jgi:hypothetical protein
VFDPSFFILGVLVLFCVTALGVILRGVIAAAIESTRIRAEAAALAGGGVIPSERKRRAARLKRRGIGLYPKLTLFSIALVLIVSVMISAPLYIRMTADLRETLFESLKGRVEVLLQGFDGDVRSCLADGNTEGLDLLPRRISAVPVAKYLTITEYGGAGPVFEELVLASNDPHILEKIDTPELRPGVSRLNDSLSLRLQEIVRELDRRVKEETGVLNENIAALNQETYVEPPCFSENSGGADGSDWAFNDTFIFFRPVIYLRNNGDYYFRCFLRLEVSVRPILDKIAADRRGLLIVILLIAGVAQIIGIIGVLVLSTWIIRPVRELAVRIEGAGININSRDELAVLGDAINDMAAGLAKATQASRDISVGKELQKKFIPLETDGNGNKLSFGFTDTPNAQFYGYYEGAKGISGDYFDYLDLDGRYYAIIKCDVAGKGVPAALIMIQVATMFLNHFKNWTTIEAGEHIEELVYQINDFIEALGFEGRFAAFALCLFDSKTGLLRFCNAGDNIIHYYDKSEGKMKSVKLRENPAAGILPNTFIESKGGYAVQTMTLDHGDILFLYTDGIEEARRRFRDSSFNGIICGEGGAPANTPHGNHLTGQGTEDLGRNRVEEIINAVMNRGTYSLYKYHNGEGEQSLHFDFSACEGTIEEAVTALVSVEKIFRLYKDPASGEEDRALVDRKVDEFLKAHFLEYRVYCAKSGIPGKNNAYLYYTHIKEDPQYDDLTIVGIKRK